jgi:glycolate oxidase
MYSADDVAFMQRLRAAIDPQQLANRGKMLGVTAEAQRGYGLHPLEKAGVISRV